MPTPRHVLAGWWARKLIWNFEHSHVADEKSSVRNTVYEVCLTENEGVFVRLIDQLTLFNFQAG